MRALGTIVTIAVLLASVQSVFGQRVGESARLVPDETVAVPALNPNLVKNPSLENTKHTWLDTRCNYMALTAGSTIMGRWDVAAVNKRERQRTTNRCSWPDCNDEQRLDVH